MVADGVEVLYKPDLLPPIRYPGDHQGVEGFGRDPLQRCTLQTPLAEPCTSAGSSIAPPRPALTRIAPGAITVNASESSIPRVSSVRL